MQMTNTKTALLAVLCLTAISTHTIAGSVPKESWFPSGLDVVRDPLTGRLGVPEFYGETVVSGSANSPVIWQDPVSKDAHLYIGASNGGVYMRHYTYAEDRWSDRWTWVSRPGSGYAGSQSIGTLSLSPDGHYLAVGQGNASNYSDIGVPGNGIQIGAIQADGSIRWLDNSSEADALLSQGLPIRGLQWQGQGLVATTWNTTDTYRGKNGQPYIGGTRMVASQSEAGGIANVGISTSLATWNLVMDSTAAGSVNRVVLTAGHNVQPATGAYSNMVGVMQSNGAIQPLLGSAYSNFLQELETSQLNIARIALYPRPVDGALIAFVGSYATTGSQQSISRIDRLSIDPVTHELIEFLSADVQGKIGTAQAANDGFYGNFSLSANPLDPLAFEVFSGGNTYGGINAYTYAGGLVGVGFGLNPASLDYLYGPLGSNGQIGDPPPGAPHADSRQITYYETPKGWNLIQSDDGGIWQLPLQSVGIRWWSSLSAPGLNTLENTTADWNSTTHSIVAAYQDNAASVGRFESAYPYMQNVWMGDGQLAFFDDAELTAMGRFTSAYVSSYQYLAMQVGNIQRIALDESGFFKSYDNIGMYLDLEGEVVPFSESFAFTSQELPVPFSAPLNVNAYRSGDIVMAGRFNVYETTQVDPRHLPDSLVFQALFGWNVDPQAAPEQLNTYWVNSLDNQGSPQGKPLPTAFDSLYVGLQIAGPGGDDVRFSGIYGRQAGDSASLAPIFQADISDGPIVAIAHRPDKNQGDTVYWLQGGDILATFGNSKVAPSADQKLGIRAANGQTRTIPLTDLSLVFSLSDAYKAQSLIYVPAVNGHGEYLVIGSQEGAWISSLNDRGEPGPFTRMNWQGLPEATPPGSFNVTMKYDPLDDLLVSTQLGQGVWLYSFTGAMAPAKLSDQPLIVTNTVLQQQAKPDLDKRGNQMNTGLFIQLNEQLTDPKQAYDVEVVFHDFAQWQNNLELLTPTAGAVGKTPASYNLLDDSGQARFHASLNNGQLTLPIHFVPGVTKMVITVNIKGFPEFVPSFSLNFTAALKGSGASTIGHLVLSSGSPAHTVYVPSGRSVLDPFSPAFDPQNEALPRFRYGSEKWVAGPIFHIPGQGYSEDDIVYVGTHGNKVKTGKGADLLYIDGNTTGTNQLFGGPGKNQFRLVSTYGDLPTEPQWVMDFKPGKDTIGLVGVTYEDLSFKNSPQGAELHVFGEKVGIFRNIGKQALKRRKNFIFYP